MACCPARGPTCRLRRASWADGGADADAHQRRHARSGYSSSCPAAAPRHIPLSTPPLAPSRHPHCRSPSPRQRLLLLLPPARLLALERPNHASLLHGILICLCMLAGLIAGPAAGRGALDPAGGGALGRRPPRRRLLDHRVNSQLLYRLMLRLYCRYTHISEFSQHLQQNVHHRIIQFMHCLCYIEKSRMWQVKFFKANYSYGNLEIMCLSMMFLE
uniref:Uncharacterized protein n=1 Tax=Triticum urartu TaxID=4572 RepID=A0A8R7U0G3_TRIUA